MSVFKQGIMRDVHRTFLNLREFSDMHRVNGRMMAVQVDDSENLEREKRFSDYIDGVYAGDQLIYVAASDYGLLPAQGSVVEFDGQDYTVAQALDEGGVFSIQLTSNCGRTNDGTRRYI